MKEHPQKQTGTHSITSVSQETLLKLSKEITIKFIEVGRVTPSTFSECFSDIYTTLESAVKER